MKAHEFCYWLQGLFELASPEALSAEQTATIKRHLDMVFIHDIDPKYPAAEQSALNDAHNAKPAKIGGHDPITGAVFRC